jgi:transcriptional regulator with XRE-family HTH domain
MADEPNPIDREVGRRLKLRRTLLGMSQERLGELLGITYQQIQKYERGANRIGSSRLYEICRILEVPVAYFFDQPMKAAVPMPPEPPRLAYGSGLYEVPGGFSFDTPSVELPPPRQEHGVAEERETLELVRAFRRIHDPQIRRRLYELAKALGRVSLPG